MKSQAFGQPAGRVKYGELTRHPEGRRSEARSPQFLRGRALELQAVFEADGRVSEKVGDEGHCRIER